MPILSIIFGLFMLAMLPMVRCCRFYEKQPKSEKVFAENIQIRDEVAKYISWGIKILSRLRVMSLP
jgi:hypothetical protein